ncbi:MAG: SagB/ThcOx family dehydrogenase [Desulfobacterales bacterium]|nr:MAG: SagB/ThcOx family dehydrogenase [Desulfobacterales bacterium]
MQSLAAENVIKLPAPQHRGLVSVERALATRRSVRNYRNEPLELEEASQLLWSAQGVSNSRGYRTAPSAGALYPLEVYAAVGNVKDLEAGIYKYIIREHALMERAAGDRRQDICRAALHQSYIATAPVVLLFCTVNRRVTNKYGERGMRYVFMEVGHAAQNVCLQAVALGLGTVVIGAFRDSDVKVAAHMAEDEHPAYIIAIGRYNLSI